MDSSIELVNRPWWRKINLALPGRSQRSDVPSDQERSQTGFRLADLIFWAGLLALAIPTLLFVAQNTWSDEQGAHGPIILATGLWLFWNQWGEVRGLVRPPRAWRPLALIVIALPIYLFTRITQIAELEGYAMYALVVIAFYALVGGRVIQSLAFPIIYMAFAFPPPETLIYILTMPIKIAITESSIAILQALGYPIGGTGVMIQIGQYQLLVAAACSGLNSIVSLSALTLFYIYLMHRHDRRLQLILLLFVIPVAVAANFLRVLILILLTYHAGEATAQSFMHDLAGITTFVLALSMIFLFDLAFSRIVGRREAADAQGVTQNG